MTAHRRSCSLVALLGATFLATAAVAGSAPAAGDVEAGRKVFVRSCRVCHQVDPAGANTMGPNLAGMAGKPAAFDTGY